MSLVSRVRLLALALVVVTATLVGSVVFWGYRSILGRQQRDTLTQQVRSEASRLTFAFEELRHDIEILARLRSLQAIVRGDSHLDPADPGSPESDLAQTFAAVLRAKPFYAQVRLIGWHDQGREIVRVNRVDGAIVRTEESHLQRKEGRDYVLEGQRLAPESSFFSRVSLNQEHGVIEVPHRSMMRAAITLAAPGDQTFGIVIINLDFGLMVSTLLGPDRDNVHYLASSSGDYLLHPDPGRTFGFDLGRRYLLQQEFPGAIGLTSAQCRAGSDAVLAVDGGLLGLQRVAVLPDRPDLDLLFGIEASGSRVRARSWGIAWRASAVTAALLAVALVGAYLAASILGRPLSEIAEAADQLGQGNSVSALPVERRDEVGHLARVFERMAAAVKERETRVVEANQALLRANQDVEHFARIASHELREPARRLLGLAELLRSEAVGSLSDEGGALLGRIEDVSVGMLDQLNDFRVFAALTPGGLRRGPVDLGATFLRLIAESERPSVPVELDPSPTLEVYESLAAVLLRNLLDNALQHADPERLALRLTATRTPEGWVLGVHNTGSTIAAAKLESIFAPFTRPTAASQAPGFGLSIARRIVERHSGRIWAQAGEDHVHVQFTLGKESEPWESTSMAMGPS